MNPFRPLFAELFRTHNPGDPTFRTSLTQTIIHCFHLKTPSLNTAQKAIQILDSLFTYTGHEAVLSTFCGRFQLTVAERRRLCTALLYGLYFGDVELTAFHPAEFALFQLWAEQASQSRLKSILTQLPVQDRLNLAGFLYLHYREGSWFILEKLEEITAKPWLKKIFINLRRGLFDPYDLMTEITNGNSCDQTLFTNLKQQSESRIEQAYWNLHKLILAVVESPVQVFETLEKLKKPEEPTASPEARKQVYAQRETLRQMLEIPFTQRYKFADFKAFVELFGLRHLTPQLQEYHVLFTIPINVAVEPPSRILGVIVYLQMILRHLEALGHSKEHYKLGLDRLALAISTSGKHLSRLAGPSSLLRALGTLTTHLEVRLSNYPIFLFDESLPPLLKRNRRILGKLNRQYKSTFVLVSREEMIALADRLRIRQLIQTDPKGSFGFGGARNALFLLAPLLQQAHRHGIRSVEQILRMEEQNLHALFRQSVLDPTCATIFLCDDDVAVPECNLFSYVLYAHERRDLYSAAFGSCVGRETKRVPVPQLESILSTPWNSTLFPPWQQTSTPASMSEQVCKPRLCLNLPSGAEECHFIGRIEQIPLLQPAWHLSGPRFPTAQIPTHPWIGLDERMTQLLPQVLERSMIHGLLDPLNKRGVCALPWNDAMVTQNFSCLGHLLGFISKPEVQQEMQKRFWNNLKTLISGKDQNLLRTNLQTLMSLDIDHLMNTQNSLILSEKRALAKLGMTYKRLQKDIKHFWEFAQRLQHVDWDQIQDVKKEIGACSGYPLSEFFCLLLRSVGEGDFNALVRKIESYP